MFVLFLLFRSVARNAFGGKRSRRDRPFAALYRSVRTACSGRLSPRCFVGKFDVGDVGSPQSSVVAEVLCRQIQSRSDWQPAAAPGRRAAFSRRSKASPSARLRAYCKVRCRRHRRAAAWGRRRPAAPCSRVRPSQAAADVPHPAGPSARLQACFALKSVRQDRAGRSLRPAEARSSRPAGPLRACPPQAAPRAKIRLQAVCKLSSLDVLSAGCAPPPPAEFPKTSAPQTVRRSRAVRRVKDPSGPCTKSPRRGRGRSRPLRGRRRASGRAAPRPPSASGPLRTVRR